ncbi:MAG TPA: PAS domain S-box protein [Nitrospira sp.]|nr:PAS domain S-box protein [Nitrospira sp.]
MIEEARPPSDNFDCGMTGSHLSPEPPNVAHLAAIVESSDDAIISTDLNGLILSWNPAATRIYGYTRSEAIGQPITILFPKDRLSEETVNLQNIRQGKRIDPYDTVRKRKDGTPVLISLAVSPIKDPAGQIIGASKSARNITELKRIEEELRALTIALDERVAQRTAALTQSQTRLRALASQLSLAEERVRRKLATELHDYLGQMLVLCRLKLTKKYAAGQHVSMAQQRREADRILQEAIAYTRSLVAQLTPPILREFGLVTALTWLGDQMKQHGLHVEITVEVSSVDLPEEHAILLFQSVRELLMNVVKHAGSQQATLTIGLDLGRLSLTVCDNGTGFDAARELAGNHFGLFSIRERMEGIGGTFDIAPLPQRGTIARLSLPLVPSLHAMETGSHQDTSHPALTQIGQTPIVRILMVDDHPLVRQGLRGVVEGFANMEVVGEASNGKEAVQLALDLRPNVIIMDINMPLMNGVEATQVIKNQCPEITVVGLSVNNDRQVQAAMKAAGASAYLSKDVAPEMLYQVICAALGATTSGNQDSAQSVA